MALHPFHRTQTLQSRHTQQGYAAAAQQVTRGDGGGGRAAPAEGRGPAPTSEAVVGEGSGRSPLLPRAGPLRPSLGRAVRTRLDPAQCKRLVDCARPG